MPPRPKSAEKPSLVIKRAVSLTSDHNAIVEKLADELAQPGSVANFSEALRKIIAEWSAGRRAPAPIPALKRGRKKSGENPD